MPVKQCRKRFSSAKFVKSVTVFAKELRNRGGFDQSLQVDDIVKFALLFCRRDQLQALFVFAVF